MTSPTDNSTTDTSAIIAVLRAERDAGLAREAALAEELAARTAELAERNTEYRERIGQQAGTIGDAEALTVEIQELRAAQAAGLEVLQAMIASPGDTQPVFDLIAREAAKLCDVPNAVVARFDGAMIHLVTHTGMEAADAEVLAKQFPRPPSKDIALGRAILARRIEQIEDLTADPDRAFTPPPGQGSVLAVPLLRDGAPLGAIAIGRQVRGPFSRNQITLLQTFAEQAVIAITSAETYRALQTRTSDLQETLEYQTATSDVLKVISRSAFDLQPVLDTLVETAARLCDADMAGIGRREGELVRGVAFHGYPPEYRAWIKSLGAMPLDRHIVGHRAALEGRVVHVHDVAAEPNYPTGSIALGKMRTSLGVPLLREGETVGSIVLARQRVEPFTDRQIELVSTFADQAVIAIENTRLLTEQREALEQQTATAEVLQVINASPGNLVPVFEAILEKAHTLCGAAVGSLMTYDGQFLRAVAVHGFQEQHAALVRRPFLPHSGHKRLIRGERLVHIADLKALEPEADSEVHRSTIERTDVRTCLTVPLRKDGAFLGYISAFRKEVRPFGEKEIALLENFAAQAVIAMENARLITEQREALEQQTATAEVLQVINASPGNLTPVFDAMLDKAMRLCEASYGELRTYDGQTFHIGAMRGVPENYARFMVQSQADFGPETGPGRVLRGEPLVHVLDLADTDNYRAGEPNRRALVDLGGARTLLLVPLRKDEEMLGYIMIYRTQVRPFTDKQIALLQNFAAQAVIAMENARLLTEQQEALEQQTATAEVLEVINNSPGNLTPVFEAILEKAHRLCGAALGSIVTFDGEYFRAEVTHGYPEHYAAYVRRGFRANADQQALVDGGRFIHIADLRAAGPWQDDEVQRFIEATGVKAFLVVPLRKDGDLLGFIGAHRQEARAFTDKEITLLENFAAQAVIAMENARLITEQQEALEQQTATADVLRVINVSPGDLTPVFDAILDKAHSLCGATVGNLAIYKDGSFHAVATHGFPEQVASLMLHPSAPNTYTRKLIRGERFHQIEDLRAIEISPHYLILRALVEHTDVRTVLFVPLRKDGALLGFISVNRPEVRPFSEKEIALLENFAAQAVIAMENARLITEQREALEQQTATAEVLQVINASPGNLLPVFDAMLQKATELCAAAFGILWTFDGEHYNAVAFRNVPPAYSEFLRDPPPATPLTPLGRIAAGEAFAQIADMADEIFAAGGPLFQRAVELAGFRTIVGVPLRKDAVLLGAITIYRQEVRPFSGKQIALLQNFAAQAVVAMENARLLNEVRQRQEELRITFENMGDGVAMFDEMHHLVAWNRKFQDILDVPDDIIARRQTFSEYVHYLAERGEYDPDADPEEHVRRLIEQVGQSRTHERTRPDGRVIEIRQNPVPGGGFVLIYADITERKRNEAEIRAARDAAEEANRTIEAAYRELKTAQANLIQAEKMASLGQLTAGIAHEIKNPLNFVNNFAELSVDLLGELRDAIAPAEPALTEKQRAEVEEVSVMLTSNLEKITEHGKRADGIVKAMLEHSRGSSGERRLVDLNALIDEALNLAYHGARAQDQTFNITLERVLGEGIAPIEVNPQDITRVFLNIFANGFYAVTRRAREGGDAGFVPTLKVTTIDAGEAVEIRVRDNGTGIPADIRDKLFQPFFTTKPTGEGTGLGLSITHDIVTQQHGGSIAVDSKVGEYSEFVIRLPRKP